MDFPELIGLAAGVLTTVSTLPQLQKSLRTKSTGDISWGYLAMLIAGIALWTVYGFLISSAPVILANGITTLLMLALAFLKLKFDKKGKSRSA